MSRRSFPVAAAALLVAGLAVPALTSSASAAPAYGEQRVCAAPTAGHAACDAHVRTVVGRNGKPQPATTGTPAGYSASQLQVGYNLVSAISAMAAAGTHPLVAIVDAYANPNAHGDLDTYRATMNLPPVHSFTEDDAPAITGNTSWGQEEMLDLEMVSAACPACDILYAGAASPQFTDLGAAVNRAVADHAVVVSNSYGGSESSGELSIQKLYYTHPGVAITVSSGDNGYGVQSPAAFNTVTAVGGTSLQLDSGGNYQGETAWSGAGSGCSAYVAKPSWQHDSGCSRRTVADVSAVADPNTGVAVYDTYGSTGSSWYVFGGTSVAAPLIGGVYALSGSTTGSSTTTPAGVPAVSAYGASGTALHDITSGSNTRRCRAGYLCQAVTGYDGPTGNGTPNGTTAF